MEEGSGSVGAQDVENGLDDTAALSTTFLVEPLAASGETVVRTVCRV